MLDNAMEMIQGEKYNFYITDIEAYEVFDLIAVPEDDEYPIIVLEQNTTAGNQTILALKTWWNEQNK